MVMHTFVDELFEPTISRSGIPPGGQFDYIVPINSSGQWGTYWVHSHASVCYYFQFYQSLIAVLQQGQYVDGLRAPLVLHPPTEAHAYDDEFTVVLGDWYHSEHSVLAEHFSSIANPGGAEPVPSWYLLFVFFPFSSCWSQTRVSFTSHKTSPTLAQYQGSHPPLSLQQSDSMKMLLFRSYLGRPIDCASSICLLYQRFTSGLMVTICVSSRLTV